MLGWQKELKLIGNHQRSSSSWKTWRNGKAIYTKVGSCPQFPFWLSGAGESWIMTRKWSWCSRLAVLTTGQPKALGSLYSVGIWCDGGSGGDEIRNHFESENILMDWASLKTSKQGSLERQTDWGHQAAVPGLDTCTIRADHTHGEVSTAESLSVKDAESLGLTLCVKKQASSLEKCHENWEPWDHSPQLTWLLKLPPYCWDWESNSLLLPHCQCTWTAWLGLSICLPLINKMVASEASA